jgi:hypothetical protein
VREKAFILTADALFALTAIGLLATAYAVLGSAKPQSAKYADLEQQGRDYLGLVYREGFANFTADNFSQLTGHNCTGGCLGEKSWGFSAAAEASDWTPILGTWAVGAGTFTVTPAGVPPNAYGIAAAGRQTWGNYNFSAKIDLTAATRVGIGINANTSGGRYVCQISLDGMSNCVLGIFKVDFWVPTATTSWSSLSGKSLGTWATVCTGQHTLNTSVKEGHIRCSLDSDPLYVTEYDAPAPRTLHTGGIPLESTANTAFDDATVSLVPQDPPYGTNFSLRSVLVDYPWRCGCAPYSEACNVSRGSGCLGQPDYNYSDYNSIYREVWVS